MKGLYCADCGASIALENLVKQNYVNLGEIKMEKCKINEWALKAILMNNNIGDAPCKTQRAGKHYEVIVGIGKDHVATLTLDEEAYFELYKIPDK